MSDSPRQQTTAGHTRLGSAPGQTRLDSAGAVRPLGTTGSVLPELAEAPERERTWWRHPAFLVSVGLTVLALLGATAWFIVSALTDDSVRVSALAISDDAGNVHLDWDGPDAAYAIFAVGGDGDVADLSQLVRGTEAWIPAAAGLYEDDTCFVVRPADVGAEVSLDASALGGQGGRSACIADSAE
ncbi:hypothetical protein [Agromyces sp. Soil535]|uniref:hypothetical protein n=1 Tax=Agromyces sp. Soil535 TaxID=1736390 RepID=UPI0006F648FC|nr:hypothetical protein [Agromyces sp. Soil535]KRE21012.1 hypothetical protein ASG80_15210 [Agromyces sp. Soil535]